MKGRLGDRLIRLAGRVVTGPGQASTDRPRRDRFAEYRDLAGPELVGGPTPQRSQPLDDDGRVVVLLPHLTVDRMSGGPNTILQITARLAREGIPVKYVAAFGPMDQDEGRLREHIEIVTGIAADRAAIALVDASADGATLDLGVDDILVATWWPTAHVANAALRLVRAKAFVYLIQDYEPGFYPWSSKYALAEATYAMPFRGIVNEATLLHHLRASAPGFRPDTPTVSFTPAVDRGVFAPRAGRTGDTRRLAFYARPKNARNLFDLGLRALRTAADRGVFDASEWEFAAFGQEIPELAISDRHMLRPVPWLDYRAYGRFLVETDLLLSLMLSPHTSYPPLEMAATGGRVVTNTFGAKTAEALRALSPAIHGVEPDVESLVAALAAAVRAIDDGDALTGGGAIATVSAPASWDEALADAVPWLVRTIRELRGER